MPPKDPTRYEAAMPQMREAIAFAVDIVAQLVAEYPDETLLTGAAVARVRDHIYDPYVLAAAWAIAGIAVTKDEDLAALVREVVAELLALTSDDGTRDDLAFCDRTCLAERSRSDGTDADADGAAAWLVDEALRRHQFS